MKEEKSPPLKRHASDAKKVGTGDGSHRTDLLSDDSNKKPRVSPYSQFQPGFTSIDLAMQCDFSCGGF